MELELWIEWLLIRRLRQNDTYHRFKSGTCRTMPKLKFITANEYQKAGISLWHVKYSKILSILFT